MWVFAAGYSIMLKTLKNVGHQFVYYVPQSTLYSPSLKVPYYPIKAKIKHNNNMIIPILFAEILNEWAEVTLTIVVI